jgi:hypothetical protein
MRFLYPAFYVLFGLSVVGGYGVSRVAAYDVWSTSVDRQTLGPQYRRGGLPGGAVYRPPAIFWYGGLAGGK